MSNNAKTTFIGKNINVELETLKEVLGENETVNISVNLINKGTVYFKVDGSNHLFTSKDADYKVGDTFSVNGSGEIVTESLKPRKESLPSGSGCSLKQVLATGNLF